MTFSTTRIGSLLVLCACALCACIQVNLPDLPDSASSVWPEIPGAERPDLAVVTSEEIAPLSEDVRQRLLDNDQKLKNWGARLEAQIAEYNRQREER